MFNRDALVYGDLLADVVAAIEDRCTSSVEALDKSKKVLTHFYKEINPKGVALEDVDSLAEALADDAPVKYKHAQKGVGSTMGLAMVLASGAQLDLTQV